MYIDLKLQVSLVLDNIPCTSEGDVLKKLMEELEKQGKVTAIYPGIFPSEIIAAVVSIVGQGLRKLLPLIGSALDVLIT